MYHDYRQVIIRPDALILFYKNNVFDSKLEKTVVRKMDCDDYSIEYALAYAICKTEFKSRMYTDICKSHPSAAVCVAKTVLGRKRFEYIVKWLNDDRFFNAVSGYLKVDDVFDWTVYRDGHYYTFLNDNVHIDAGPFTKTANALTRLANSFKKEKREVYIEGPEVVNANNLEFSGTFITDVTSEDFLKKCLVGIKEKRESTCEKSWLPNEKMDDEE